MANITQEFTKEFLKKNLPHIKVGDIVKMHQKITEGDKQRIQLFEGVVLSIKHGRGVNATITVRKIIGGVGVEKTYPLHSPNIEKIEIVSRSKVRRSKLYYLRELTGKKAKLKRYDYVPSQETLAEKSTPEPAQEETKKVEIKEVTGKAEAVKKDVEPIKTEDAK